MGKKKEKSTKAGTRNPARGKATASTATSKGGTGKDAMAADKKRLDGIAERLLLGSRAFRADVVTLLAEVRKGQGKPSSKARKIFAGVAKEYRKAAKDLKKLSAGKG